MHPPPSLTRLSSRWLALGWVALAACAATPPTPTGEAPAAATPDASESPEGAPAPPEAEMLERINLARAEAGLGSLTWDPALAAVAEAHAREMARDRYVAHESPVTGAFTDRLRAAGYLARTSRENVGAAASVASAQQAFLASPGHRRNLLDPQVTHVGLGIAREEGARTLYVTQLLADPAREHTPEAMTAAFLHRVAVERRRRGLSPLRRDPLLGSVVAGSLAKVEDGVTGQTLARISAAGVRAAQAAGRRDLLALEVMGWRVVDARDATLQPALLAPDVWAVGVGARRTDTDRGPRFDLVALVARGR